MNRVRDRLSSRQLGAFACTAAGVPIFRVCSRVSWRWVLAGGVVAACLLSALTYVLNRRRTAERSPVSRLLLTPLLWIGALIAAWESSFSFPETAGSWLAAGLVLTLAAAAAWTGPAACARSAGILLWVTGALYATVLIFSLPQIRVQRLAPAGSARDALAVLGALTVPGAALCLGSELGEDQRLPQWPWWTAFGAALAASVVTGGILSPALARDPEAFRTLARGVSVLGVIRRFEALVNGALLMSGFALCALYLCPAIFFIKKRKKGLTSTERGAIISKHAARRTDVRN